MSTAKTVAVVLFLLLAFGIVGRMDYEDAKRTANGNGEEGMRLFCVRFGTAGSGPRISETAAFEASPPTFLRCVVVEE